MKYTSMVAIIALFKIRFCIHIAILQYHTTFAMIISQCSQQYHIIQKTGIFTINWFDDFSASWVHRGTTITPPPPIELTISKPRGDNKDSCNL